MRDWLHPLLRLAPLLLGTLAAAEPAVAEVRRVVVSAFGELGVYGGRDYVWATAHMEGRVSREDGTAGAYRVPVTLYYPQGGSNGFGFVDVVNNADFYNFPPDRTVLGEHSVNYTGATILSDFLRMEGFTYFAVQWSKMTTELLGPDYGMIERGEDGYEILKDAARWLRDAGGLAGTDLAPPAPVTRVIGHGMSHSTSILTGFLWRGDNREPDGSLVYDGFLFTTLEPFSCRLLSDAPSFQELAGRPRVALYTSGAENCRDLPGDGRVIHLRTQSDVERRGNEAHELPGYRLYDLAGAAHVPEFIKSLKFVGADRQNPADWRPVARAMLRHLADWIATGAEPPEPLYIEGTFAEDGTFRLATDADGNALGGIRLPHLTTVLPSGEVVGAPLGRYAGLNPEYPADEGYGYAWLGGIFDPFPEEERARRYPTRSAYVDLVRGAAAALLAEGYILGDGYETYVRAAERQPLPLDFGK